MTVVSAAEVACLEQDGPLASLARVDQTDGPIRVLFVEDDRYHRKLLVNGLSACGFTARGFADNDALLGALAAGVDADIIIVLDGPLSKTSGMDLLPHLRRHGVDLPVVFLAGRPQTAHESLAFDRGAIDFIDNRHGVDVPVGRLKRAVEAAKLAADSPPDKPMICGRVVLRPDVKRAYWDEVDLGLTCGEYDILHFLVSNAGRFVTYRAIYDRMHYEGFIAGCGTEGYRANVRSAIKRIRGKFRERDPIFAEIENYTSFGYGWRKPNGA